MDYQLKFNVPMSSPDLSDEEREAVNDVMRGRSLSMGPYLEMFERAVRDFTGAAHAIAVNSGTAGLHLGVRALGWSDGDFVITTPFSFVASTNALLYERIIPIFVDVDPRTGNIAPELVAWAVADWEAGGTKREKLLPRRGAAGKSRDLKGVLAVDVFGQPADYDSIRTVCAANGMRVIEDSCEALGALYKDRAAGLLGAMGVYAFYPNKQITTGEGGMIVTNDDELAVKMRALRNQGRAPNDTWLEHTYLGYNYRMSELNAALGAVQMRRIESLIAGRQRVADWYFEELADMDGVELPAKEPTTTRDSWFVFVIRLASEIDRNEVIRKLSALGVPTRPYFALITDMPYLREKFGYQTEDYPVAADLGRRGLAIPFSGVMTRDQVAQVGAALRQVLG